jgi:hypothetical protein
VSGGELPAQDGESENRRPSRRSLRGLDCINFLIYARVAAE